MVIPVFAPRSFGDFRFRFRLSIFLTLLLIPWVAFAEGNVKKPRKVRKPVTQTSAETSEPAVAPTPFSAGQANVYSQVLVKGQYIAMTFDDGPSAEYTPTLLDELKKRNMKVTFFLVGQNVQEFPQIVKRELAEGHEIANHSWSHPNLARMSDAAVTEQIQKTQDAIFAACGVKPIFLRPPYGSITKAQKHWIRDQLGLQMILWSVDPNDWKKPGEAVVRSRIVNGAHDGAIILAHDIHGSTVRAMPETFDQLLAKGYKFVTVSELLAMEQPKTAPTPRPVTESTPAALPPTPADPNALPTPIPLSTAEQQVGIAPGTTPAFGDSTPSVPATSAPSPTP